MLDRDGNGVVEKQELMDLFAGNHYAMQKAE